MTHRTKYFTDKTIQVVSIVRRYAVELALCVLVVAVIAAPAIADDETKIMQTDGPRILRDEQGAPAVRLWVVDWQGARCIVARDGSAYGTPKSVALSCDWGSRK